MQAVSIYKLTGPTPQPECLDSVFKTPGGNRTTHVAEFAVWPLVCCKVHRSLACALIRLHATCLVQVHRRGSCCRAPAFGHHKAANKQGGFSLWHLPNGNSNAQHAEHKNCAAVQVRQWRTLTSCLPSFIWVTIGHKVQLCFIVWRDWLLVHRTILCVGSASACDVSRCFEVINSVDSRSVLEACTAICSAPLQAPAVQRYLRSVV